MRLGIIATTGLIGLGLMRFYSNSMTKCSQDSKITLENRSTEDNKRLISYEATRDNEDLRQEYVNQQFNKNLPYFVSEVIYDPRNVIVRNYILDLVKDGKMDEDFADSLLEELVSNNKISEQFMRNIVATTLFGIKSKTPVFITDRAFKKYNQNEFCSALIEHEFVHAEDIYNGIKLKCGHVDFRNIDLLSSEVIRSMMELRALRNQMTKWIVDGGIAYELYFVNLSSGFIHYYLTLDKVKPNNSFEVSVRAELLEQYKKFIPKRFFSKINP